MNKLETIFRRFALPIFMTLGVMAYLIFHWTPFLWPAGPLCHKLLTTVQPMLVFVMLFLQFNRISPHDIKFRPWHLWLLLIQGLGFAAFGMVVWLLPQGDWRLVAGCAMLCMITPTAMAAGVITGKLGGSLPGIMSYMTFANCMVTLLIPAIIPLLYPNPDHSFLQSMGLIAAKLFPMLILPCIVAWTIRYTMRKLQIFLMRYTFVAFWVWCISLAICLTLTTRTLVLSHLSAWVALLIGLVTAICCFGQFHIGHRIGQKYGAEDRVTAGQSLGQKNTVFAIWLGYTFMTPTTSIAGGFYCIWHNIVNSLELYKKEKEAGQARLP